MAKKSVRKIPKMLVTVKGDGAPDVEALSNNEVFADAVYHEAVEGISDAIKSKIKTAILFELGQSEYYVEIEKHEWKQALQTCLDRLIDVEDYTECARIRDLINKI